MKMTFLLSLVITAAALAACTNTAEGVGRDVESAGQTIQDTF